MLDEPNAADAGSAVPTAWEQGFGPHLYGFRRRHMPPSVFSSDCFLAPRNLLYMCRQASANSTTVVNELLKEAAKHEMVC